MVYFDPAMHNYAGNDQLAFWHRILINCRAHCEQVISKLNTVMDDRMRQLLNPRAEALGRYGTRQRYNAFLTGENTFGSSDRKILEAFRRF